ncbi:MAG: HEAT repeat domain-containing protein [Spirochaetes bacterium]|nr:HEAT repeat domain-containing protein [Spirochaetota bacterium]
MRFFTPGIRRLEKRGDIRGLLKCLAHRRSAVRYGAFVALAGMKGTGDEVLQRLREMVHDPDPWVKTLAVLKFAGLGDPSVSDSLREIITEGSRDARLDLLKIIAGRGPTEDGAIREVIVLALADRKEVVRLYAIVAAASTGDARLMPALAERLQEQHYEMRIQAARTLYAVGGDGSADYLMGLLADRHSSVQEEARSLLANIRIAYVQRALHDAEFLRLVRGMNDTEPARRETAQLIGGAAIREGLPLLHRACYDKYKGVRIEALRAMAAFRSPSSIEYAQRLLRDRFYDVRLEAVATLAQITDPRSIEALQGALDDRVLRVREAARRACERIRRDLQYSQE